MAIRAAELNIPAVIGCGQKFDELKNSSEIEIDCLNKNNNFKMKKLKFKPGLLWITGLSGSGKTTISQIILII